MKVVVEFENADELRAFLNHLISVSDDSKKQKFRNMFGIISEEDIIVDDVLQSVNNDDIKNITEEDDSVVDAEEDVRSSEIVGRSYRDNYIEIGGNDFSPKTIKKLKELMKIIDSNKYYKIDRLVIMAYRHKIPISRTTLYRLANALYMERMANRKKVRGVNLFKFNKKEVSKI